MDDWDRRAAEYVGQREHEYNKFLDDVIHELNRFKDRSSLSQSIYRVYSRADKQPGGRRLKTIDGIAVTLRRWAKSDPSVSPVDLHDIIGVTIVTYFDSEVPRVVEALRKQSGFAGFFSTFNFVDAWSRPSEEERAREDFIPSYFAMHVKVASLHGAEPVLCEIQVKSLLNDGWAAKIHDLVYKAKTKLDPEIERQAKLAGGMVNALEQMSDGLRALITRNQQIENDRRTTATSTLMKALLSNIEQSGTDDEAKWYRDLVDQIDHLKNCEDNDPVLLNLVANWRAMFSSKPRTMNGCRSLLLLALVRGTKQSASDAFAAINKWAETRSDPREKFIASRFKSTSHWVLGQHDEAIEICRNLLRSAPSNVDLTRTKVDLAYYLAERSFIRDGHCAPETIEEIGALVAGWANEPEVRTRMSLQDSIGAIRIMTAGSASDVFSGHQLCADARAWSNENANDAAVFDDFYKLHTERARRKIQELPPL